MNSALNIIGLDVGQARIGVARINTLARIAEPLEVLANDETFPSKLSHMIATYDISELVIGMPRNMSGEKTAQSEIIEDFVTEVLKPQVNVPIKFQDETLSTKEASTRITDKYPKSMEDALAACVILEDYLSSANQTALEDIK